MSSTNTSDVGANGSDVFVHIKTHSKEVVGFEDN